MRWAKVYRPDWGPSSPWWQRALIAAAGAVATLIALSLTVFLPVVVVVMTVVLVQWMGVATFGLLCAIEAVVRLGRTVVPIQMRSWSAVTAAPAPMVAAAVVGTELAISAIGVAIAVAVTQRFSVALIGVAIPPWMLIVVGFRCAATGALFAAVKLPKERRTVVAMAVGMLDIFAVRTVVAAFDPSLRAVVVGSALVSIALATLAWLSICRRGAPAPAAPASAPATWRAAIVRPGTWALTLVNALPHLIVAGLLGVAAIAPYLAAGVVQLAVFYPLMLFATIPARSLALRFVRGLVLAAVGAAILDYGGAAILRFVFPPAFAAGAAWMPAAAAIAAVLVPASLWSSPVKPPPGGHELARLVSAVGGGALLVLLVPDYGVAGLFYAAAAGFFLLVAFADLTPRSD